ncbi:MAG: putative transmembrane protein (PGPGW) [Lentisphaerae bacterium ADurb.BinA184]|nr:MAG: putative transmembrane protein (PGPGW) [Lentisphaerae bacterium ADurb.BinA184]
MGPRWLHSTWRVSRRVVVAVMGGTVVLIGIVLLVTPGPALAVILGGLAILGLEFAWARRWMTRAGQGGKAVGGTLRRWLTFRRRT